MRKGLRRRKRLKNAQTPQRQVHALLGAPTESQPRELEQEATANLKKLLHMIDPLATDKKHNLPKR
jgi:hypothetical protein